MDVRNWSSIGANASEDESAFQWTPEAIRAYLRNGRNPRDEGGEAARQNKPVWDEHYCSPFMREVHARAESLWHAIDARQHRANSELLERMRRTPFAIDGAVRKMSGSAEHTDAAVKRQLMLSAADLAAARQRFEQADQTYRRDLQAAGDATHPRGGWPDALLTVLIVLAVLLFDVALSTLWLRKALGPVNALLLGGFLPSVAVAGGWGFARILLKPTKFAERTKLWRWLSLLGAGLDAAVTLVILYGGACYRAALIAGVSEGQALSNFWSPGEVFSDFDATALLGVGVLGFVVTALETWKYYHGFRPLLRRSGIARDRVESGLSERVKKERGDAADTVDAGRGELSEIQQSTFSWATAIADHADEGLVVEKDANRDLAILVSEVRLVAAEFCDGYREVLPGRPVAQISDPQFGNPFEIPQTIVTVREHAIAAAREVTSSAQRAEASLAKILEDAIREIDAMAGYRTWNQPQPPTWPKAVAA